MTKWLVSGTSLLNVSALYSGASLARQEKGSSANKRGKEDLISLFE